MMEETAAKLDSFVNIGLGGASGAFEAERHNRADPKPRTSPLHQIPLRIELNRLTSHLPRSAIRTPHAPSR
jgi:hypothetical protein